MVFWEPSDMNPLPQKWGDFLRGHDEVNGNFHVSDVKTLIGYSRGKHEWKCEEDTGVHNIRFFPLIKSRPKIWHFGPQKYLGESLLKTRSIKKRLIMIKDDNNRNSV
jgi:hypothetical protein